jgi:hypothetical protein
VLLRWLRERLPFGLRVDQAEQLLPIRVVVLLRLEGLAEIGRCFNPGRPGKAIPSKAYSCPSKGFSTQRGVDSSGRFSGPKSFSGRGKRLWMLWRGDTRPRQESVETLVKLGSFRRENLLAQA